MVRAANLEGAAALIKVVPHESADLTPAQASGELRVEEVVPERVCFDGFHEIIHLLIGKDALGGGIRFRQRHPIGGFIGNNMRPNSVRQGPDGCAVPQILTCLSGYAKILYIMDPEQGYVTARKVTDSTQKTYGYYSFIGSHGQPGYLIGYASKN